jgi:hypothetical protein
MHALGVVHSLLIGFLTACQAVFPLDPVITDCAACSSVVAPLGEPAYLPNNAFVSTGIMRNAAFAGNVDGDEGGAEDLVVGTADGASVLYGPFDNSPVLDSDDPKRGFKLIGMLDGPVGPAGDFNHDGSADIVAGNPGPGSGHAYIVLGKSCTPDGNPRTNEVLMDLDSGRATGSVLGDSTGSVLPAEADGDGVGSSVASIGNFNGDEFSDVVVGAPGAGKVYVVFGRQCSESGGVGNIPNLNDITDINRQGLQRGWSIAAPQSQARVVVARVGNFDGDLVDGAPLDDFVIASSEAVYLMYGRKTPPVAERNLRGFETARVGDDIEGFEFYGTSGEFAGAVVSPAGDFNGDGYDDFVVTMPSTVGDGAARIVFGHPRGAPTLPARGAVLDMPGLTITGIGMGGARSLIVTTAGDFNGDKVADIVVAASGAGESIVSIVFGSGDYKGSMELALPTMRRRVFYNDRTHTSVAGGGDANGDGLDDVLLVGAGESSTTALLYILLGIRDSQSAL